MNKLQYFQKLRHLILGEKTGNNASDAIKGCILTMVDFDFCSLDEFLCLVDLDFKSEWLFIADEIALKAEEAIRNERIHPNKIKPWQNCPNYPDKFGQIAGQKEWRELHSAIDTIIGRISARFHC